MIKKINPCKTLLVWGAITLKGKLYIFEYGMHENQELYENILAFSLGLTICFLM